MTRCTYWVNDSLVLTMDSTNTASDFMEEPNEDLAYVIGDEAGLAMEFESDDKVNDDRL